MRRECFPRHRLQRKPPVSDPRMHHGTCITHVQWCMPGSLTRVGGGNVPGNPSACTTRNFTYLASDPSWNAMHSRWLPLFFLQGTQKWRPIALLLGGYLSWFHSLNKVLIFLLLCCVQYPVLFVRESYINIFFTTDSNIVVSAKTWGISNTIDDTESIIDITEMTITGIHIYNVDRTCHPNVILHHPQHR